MSIVRFGCVVEGHGEVDALPALIGRIAAEVDPNIVAVVRPMRATRDRFIRRVAEFDRFVRLAALEAGEGQPVLILIDGEGDCPATLGPQLLAKLRQICQDRPTGVVVAHHEYEAWFLGDPSCIAGHFGLATSPDAPANPEAVQGVKEWIKRQLPRGRKYSETIDQLPLTRKFDLGAAKSIPSFDKLYREVGRLLRESAGWPPPTNDQSE